MSITLVAAASAIAASAATPPDGRIELRSGDVLTGTIAEETDEYLVIEHETLGRLVVPRAEIAAPADLFEVPATEEPKKPRWESKFDLGFGGSRGNTDTFDLRAVFRTQHETELDRWRIDAGYFYGESDGEKNKSQATAGVLKDWLMPDSPWLLFAQGRYDYDEFRAWTHRLSGHGGLGYEFIKTDELTVIGRLGGGAAKEWKRSDSIRPEGLVGGELTWRINDQQRLAAHTTLYPDLGDFFEFRVVSGVAWNLMLDKTSGISVHLGVENEYESSPNQGIKHNDLRFFGGVSISF